MHNKYIVNKITVAASICIKTMVNLFTENIHKYNYLIMNGLYQVTGTTHIQTYINECKNRFCEDIQSATHQDVSKTLKHQNLFDN